MICSVVEPTLIARELPLPVDGRSIDVAEADMRFPPISIGLIVLQTRQGGEIFSATMSGGKAGHRFDI